MYINYYGIKSLPFSITSDPHIFYESLSHRQALACLVYGIQEKKGIMLLTGEVGTGKTTLVKALIQKLAPEVKTSLILNPYFSENQLLQAIIEDFGISAADKTKLDCVKSLNSFLLETNAAGGNAVIVIDEAQDLNSRQLEQIRLLSNLETSSGKLLQIVLVGQPELSDKLKAFNLRQIRQRISVKYAISPLSQDEVRDYIEFRLKKAGAESIQIDPDGYRVIYEFSKGIPRLINVLCDRALLYGFARDSRVFDQKVFTNCIEELQ